MEDHPYLRNIFSLENGYAMCFKIVPEEAGHKDWKLRRLVEISGGTVLKAGETDLYEIKLLDLNWYLDRNVGTPLRFSDNIFSKAFVEDSYIRNERQDLNKYRLGPNSGIDANLVARRRLPWREIKVELDRDLPCPTGVPVSSPPRRSSRSRNAVRSSDLTSGSTNEAAPPSATSLHVEAIVSSKSGHQRDRKKGDGRSGVNLPENVETLTVLENLEKSTSSNSGRQGGGPLPFLSVTYKNFVKPATTSRKCASPKKVKSASPFDDDQTSSDEDEFQRPDGKHVTRKKFMRPRKPFFTAIGTTKALSSKKAEDTPSKKSSDCDEPESKKKKHDSGSNPGRVYSASRLYFNAKTPEKTSSETTATKAVAPGFRSKPAVSASQDTIPSASDKANPISNDECESSAVLPLIRYVPTSARQENIPDSTQKSIVPADGSSRNARVARSENPESRKTAYVLDSESSDDDIQVPPSPDRMSTASSRSTRGDPYSIEDGKVLLRYICENNLHPYHSGMRPWKKAFEDNLLEGRTASSMWEHFRKKVYPNRKKVYGCIDDDMKKFAEGERIKKLNKRAPAPANFLFKKR